MSDWERFLREASWFLGPDDHAVVGDMRPWTRGAIDGLPELSTLLSSATVTPVSVGPKAFEVLAWGPADDRRGWLCHPPRDTDGISVHPLHESFWSVCGGIAERFGEPDTWWNNHNDVLTEYAARVDHADMLSAYEWIFKDDGLEIPIDPDEYYTVAVEANGNLTLVHRVDGRLLLFAPDHGFDGVTPLAGCPPYSLLTIDDVPDLATWIEVCAAAWRGR